MKRILYLSDLKPNKLGSMEEHALFLSRELSRRGDLCYLAFTGEPQPELRQAFEDAGSTVLTTNCGHTPFGCTTIISKINDILSLYRIVKNNKIDIVHINFASLTNPSLLGIYLTSSRVVYTDHSSCHPLHRNFVKHQLSRVLKYFISCRVTRYIGVSTFVTTRLHKIDGLPTNKLSTIYNGVNTERFSPRDQLEIRRELGFPLNSCLLCSVAMLIPEKGIQYLIQAVALLVDKYCMEDLLLLIVGEGDLRSELERLTRTLSVTANVAFLGRRNDVHLIIAASDIVVVPSVWEEAFGLIIAEAMASAKPVVASNVGGIPELVDDGVTGKIVSPYDCEALAEAIWKLMSNQAIREGMSMAGREKAKQKFNLARQVAELADVYEVI